MLKCNIFKYLGFLGLREEKKSLSSSEILRDCHEINENFTFTPKVVWTDLSLLDLLVKIL